MADENEQEEARQKHDETMRRLQNLRDNVRDEITGVINRYYDNPPSDLIYEREERDKIQESLRGVQRRIDETIDSL